MTSCDVAEKTAAPFAATRVSPARSRAREWVALSALMLGYAAIFVAYYPPLPGIEDEIGFVNQTLVWSRGAISAEGAGLSSVADFTLVNGRHVAARHPGRSLVALPFMMVGGVRSVFLSGLVLHLTLTALGGLVLGRLGRSPLWAVLLLLHPTLAIYSRTVMADAASGTGLLLAALAVTSTSPFAGLGAGLAVGLAAVMRYHAALALPVVAAAFVFPRGRHRAWRRAVTCMVAGACIGGAIVAYNLAVYGTPTEPFTTRRGFFAPEFFVPHLSFYALALIVVWPAMLFAPVLDRSPIRWLVRGVCGLFLGLLALYYFHDRGSNWLETAVLGQRLLQVALPLWIVSYAGVLDDWVAAPLRRRLGETAWTVLVALACLVLLGATGVAFRRHQHHLERLLEARSDVIANVPRDALIVFEGAFTKVVGIPTEVPGYRLKQLTYEGRPAEDPTRIAADLGREERPWFLAVLNKGPGGAMTEYAHATITRWGLEPVPVRCPLLSLYVHRQGARRAIPQP